MMNILVGLLALVGIALAVLLCVLAVLLPYFVWRIHQNTSRIERHLQRLAARAAPGNPAPSRQPSTQPEPPQEHVPLEYPLTDDLDTPWL